MVYPETERNVIDDSSALPIALRAPQEFFHRVALLLTGSLSRFSHRNWRSGMNLTFTASLMLVTVLVSCGQVSELTPSGNRIIFFGDSITELGDKPGGYVSLVRDTLTSGQWTASNEVIGAGISGNKVPDLLERVDRDVIARHPKVVVIYIGINDVWHFTLPLGKGTPKDRYEDGLRTLISKIKDAGARVMLCTPSVIGERHDGSNKLDAMLDEYSAISRNVARESGASMCDLRKSFLDFLKVNNPENKESGILTTDSVHLNGAGNRFVAGEILKALKESKLIESVK